MAYSPDKDLTYFLSTVPRYCLEIFGIISNMLSLVVLSNMKIKGCFNTLLTGLSWSDFLLILTFLPMDTWRMANHASSQIPTKWPFSIDIYGYYIISTIGNTCYGASNIITCSVMVLRYISVKFPLKASVLITQWRVKWVIVLAFFVSFCTTLKTFAQFTIVETNLGNKTEHDVKLSKYVTPVFSQVTDIVQISIILFIPFALCALFALLTVITIKSSNAMTLTEKHSNAEEKRSQNERAITIMLLIVVLFFLLSCFFAGIRYVVRAKLGRTEYYSHSLAMTIFDCIASNILLLNSSINLILYSASNSAFRQTFKRKFLCRFKGTTSSKSGMTVRTISNGTSITAED